MRHIILSAALALAGCDEADYVHAENPTHAAHEHDHEHHEEAVPWVDPERAARVLLTESNHSERETEALAVVDAHEEPGHHAEALNELRVRAAAIGADAVIGMEFHHGEGHSDQIHLSGLAVRYRSLLRGESYDVIGELDVAADIDHQERAMAELQRKAGELHADLIIKIGYRTVRDTSPST